MNHLDKTAADLIYLVSCAVNDVKPNPEKCASMDLEKIYALAKAHYLTSAAAHTLMGVTELPRPYDQAMKKAIRKLALFDIERAQIIAALGKAGIWYLPLKGIILKELYPKSAMREMSDNDILCDSSRMEDVRTIMESLGYTCILYQRHAHDTYSKPPTMEFEMHRELVESYAFPDMHRYYADIKDKLLSDGSRYGYRMTDEDFYIYMICHMYKHYHFSGTGLRSLLDVYVFCKARYDRLNKEYLSAELQKLELADYEEDTRLLADKVFSLQPLDDEQQKELDFYIRSGSYGTVDQNEQLRLQHELQGDDSSRAKRKYIINYLFPHGERLKQHYPFVYRHKAVYPLFLAVRPIKGVFLHSKEIIREIKKVNRFQQQDDEFGKHNK